MISICLQCLLNNSLEEKIVILYVQLQVLFSFFKNERMWFNLGIYVHGARTYRASGLKPFSFFFQIKISSFKRTAENRSSPKKYLENSSSLIHCPQSFFLLFQSDKVFWCPKIAEYTTLIKKQKSHAWMRQPARIWLKQFS